MPSTRVRRSPLDTAIAALAGGHNRDPFSLLGPHVGEDGTPVVRAFQPAAQSMDLRLVPSGEIVPMAKRDPAGLYEVRLKGQEGQERREGQERPDYRLRITFPDAHIVEIDDPYRYGRVLTDF